MNDYREWSEYPSGVPALCYTTIDTKSPQNSCLAPWKRMESGGELNLGGVFS